MALSEISEIADLTQKILSNLAILVGGCWVYFQYFRGRTFHDRIELEVGGTVQRRGEEKYLAVAVKVKNVGLSRVLLEQEGSGLRLFLCNTIQPAPQRAVQLEWNLIGAFSVLEGHDWVEPGEVISEQHLFALPSRNIVAAVKIQLQLVSKTQMWASTAIATDTTQLIGESGYERGQKLEGPAIRTTQEEQERGPEDGDGERSVQARTSAEREEREKGLA
jgi:hypothetical protein